MEQVSICRMKAALIMEGRLKKSCAEVENKEYFNEKMLFQKDSGKIMVLRMEPWMYI